MLPLLQLLSLLVLIHSKLIHYKDENFWSGNYQRSKRFTPKGTIVDGFEMTYLDEYLSKEDNNYIWHETGIMYDTPIAQIFVLNVTSQKWLDEKQVTQPIWTHFLFVTIPKGEIKTNDILIYFTGGRTGEMPNEMDKELLLFSEITVSVQSVGAIMFQIGNQPIAFHEEGFKRKRSEDSIIAYTWQQFMKNTSNPEIINEFPMVKAALRGLDATEEFVRRYRNLNESEPIYFVASGASKRGWVTWLVGAFDSVHEKRIKGISPFVLSFLNWTEQMHHWFKALGGWSFALKEYRDLGFTESVDSEGFIALKNIIDPYSYRKRFRNLVLFEVQSSNDEFFQLDDTKFFWEGLEFKEKYLFIVPNSEHALISGIADLTVSMVAFVRSIFYDIKRPQIKTYIGKENSVHLETDIIPDNIKVWSIKTRKRRKDLRWVTKYNPCEYPDLPIKEYCTQTIFYQHTHNKYEKINDFHYTAKFEDPKDLFIGFFIQVEYNNTEEPYPLTFSSLGNIEPDIYLHADCSGKSCKGELM